MNIFDRLMSPLGKDYCMLFYGMGLLGLFFALLNLLVIVRLVLIMFIFRRKAAKNFDTNVMALGLVLGLFAISFFYCLLVYFINRIGYSMCIASLR